ncbi:MAG: ABC transporter ATP-binding protein/permease [Chloroflexota bacterium]|nr:ABC transporter ATP-binding protein/permease [Chloroflexota bacterium]
MKRLDQYRRLFSYLKSYPKEVILAYGSTLIATVLSLIVPQVIKQAIDEGLAAGEARALFVSGGIILGIAVVRGAFAFAQRYYGQWMSHRVAYDLRNEFYDKVQRLPFIFHDRAQTGDLMSRATSDISETERFVGIGMMDLVATLLLLAGIVIAMLRESVSLSLIALLPLALLVAATIRFGNLIRPMFTLIQEQMGTLSTVMQESLTGIRVVKAFAREPHELEKFNRENEEWFDRRYTVIQVWANNWPFFTFLIATSVFLLLFFGGPRAIAGEVTAGSLFAMIFYMLMLSGPVQRLGFLVNLAATASASAQRVFDILDEPNELADRSEAIVLEDVRGEVAFDDVTFGYREGQRILEDIDFVARPGQVIALMGPTGAGKSTVTNLIPRFYNPTGGTVRVDGYDLREIAIDTLRSQIGIVLQDPFLFSTTIAENIAYGRKGASMEQIVEAAKAAAAHDFIVKFPEGYETRVGERGVTLSGGQKQRIAIARALLMDPRILILDDSTSSVDMETEFLIQQALERLMKGRTTFVIAQRLVTLKNADLILVLDDGRIVQRGTHERLLAEGGLYKEIYDLQLRDQEEFKELESTLAEKAVAG